MEASLLSLRSCGSVFVCMWFADHLPAWLALGAWEKDFTGIFLISSGHRYVTPSIFNGKMVPEISAWKLNCGVRECWRSFQGGTEKRSGWWGELDGISLWIRVGLGLGRWLWGDPRLPVQSSAQTPGFVPFKFRHLIIALEGGSEFSITSSVGNSRVQAWIWRWIYPAFVLPQEECLPQKKVPSREITAVVEQVPCALPCRGTVVDVFSSGSPPSELWRKTEAWAWQR